MKLAQALCPILPVLLLVGCGNPADSVPKAETKTASTETKTSATAAGGQVFLIAPENSSINWVGSKVTGSHKGGFTKFDGELQVQNGKLANTGNKVNIDTTSLFADNDRLQGHLKSPDFFDVNQFPTAVFETTAITPNTTNSTVTGNLTLHGVTKQITFPANISVTDSSVAVDADFAINRLDFGIKFPGQPNDLIRKEVVLKLKVRATRKSPV